MPRRVLPAALAACALAAAAAHSAPRPLPVVRHQHTGLLLTDVVWTGSRLLYMQNTENTLWTAGPPLAKFAAMPRVVEETRCVVSPGRHGWPARMLFCHSPDNVVYRIDPAGRVFVFARLADPLVSDGALAFDVSGAFGFRLLVATGNSGAQSRGGTVYAVDASGASSRVGAYSSPRNGGAENMVQAPAGFGSVAGQMVLTLDAGDHGAVVAVDARGRSRVLAFLPDGANPIAVVPARLGTSRLAVPRGLYLTDTTSTDVYRVPAGALRPYAGDIVVGTEPRGTFWVVRPNGKSFTTRRIPLTIPPPPSGKPLNLEGATFVD